MAGDSFAGDLQTPKEQMGFGLVVLFQKDLMQEGIVNGLKFWFNNSKDYNGIHSATGRQRLADFFKRPVVFYEGAEHYLGFTTKYGVKEPTMIIHNSIAEHLLRTKYGANEPFAHTETVVPSETRLAALGLVIARS